jgi:hypothetical protein
MLESRIPRERDDDGSPVIEVHRERVVSDLDALGSRGTGFGR